MGDPLESWKAAAIEALAVGESYKADDWLACRYRDGYYFFWREPKRANDLARFFDADHRLEMRRFMSGDFSLGVLVDSPKLW